MISRTLKYLEDFFASPKHSIEYARETLKKTTDDINAAIITFFHMYQ